MLARECPFCALAAERIVRQGDLCLAFRDGYPVSPGHTLVIPKRHVASFFQVTWKEREELLALLDWCRSDLAERHRPDGFNVGVNDGVAAGQTVMHLHIHLIPRYAGDKADPRGGVRWLFPDKADYWSHR
ncbi:MAG: HIT family protein [Betaproteobacteria bacterium]|nr:HIT family protein [Betaproteobacteria bacterium]